MGREEHVKEILILDKCIVYSQCVNILKMTLKQSSEVKSIKGYYLLDR